MTKSKFNPKMNRSSAILSLLKNGSKASSSLLDEYAKSEKDTFSFYGYRSTGVEPVIIDGKIKYFRETGDTYWDYNMSEKKI